MMPPNCCLCSKGIETGDACELIAFKKSVDDQRWHQTSSLLDAPCDHPPETDWFCMDHQDTARAYANSTRTEAMKQIRDMEQWHLIHLDLFDRCSPPSSPFTGIGLESGFASYLEHAVSTIDDFGNYYPSQYRVSFGENKPDYAVNGKGVFEIDRSDPILLSMKKFISASHPESKNQRLLAQYLSTILRGEVNRTPSDLLKIFPSTIKNKLTVRELKRLITQTK